MTQMLLLAEASAAPQSGTSVGCRRLGFPHQLTQRGELVWSQEIPQESPCVAGFTFPLSSIGVPGIPGAGPLGPWVRWGLLTFLPAISSCSFPVSDKPTLSLREAPLSSVLGSVSGLPLTFLWAIPFLSRKASYCGVLSHKACVSWLVSLASVSLCRVWGGAAARLALCRSSLLLVLGLPYVYQ